MSLYIVTKATTGRWAITHVAPGWHTPIGEHKSRKAAILTARLLAGRAGKVEIR
jgi:hypothetical protein